MISRDKTKRKKKEHADEIDLAIDLACIKKPRKKRKRSISQTKSIDHTISREEIAQAELPIAETMEEELNKDTSLTSSFLYVDKNKWVSPLAYTEVKNGVPEYKLVGKEIEKINSSISLVDPVTESKAAIQDWYFGLPRKGNPDREKKKKLI